MAKKVLTLIKLQIPGGQANPAPPVGPALGQHGVNIMEFCKAFNAQTADQNGRITPVEITVFEDRSFTFITKTPPAAVLIKEALRLDKGSAEPNRHQGRAPLARAGAPDRRDEDAGPERARHRPRGADHRGHRPLDGRGGGPVMAQHGKSYVDARGQIDREKIYSPVEAVRLLKAMRLDEVRRDGRGALPPRAQRPPRRRAAARHAHAPARQRPGRPRRRLRRGRQGARGRGGRRRRRRLGRPREADRGGLHRLRRRDRDARPDGERRQARPHPRPARPDAEPEDGHRHVRRRQGRLARRRRASSSTAPTAARTSTSRSARRASTSGRSWRTTRPSLDEIVRAKPSAAKGRYIQQITLTSTMGPGIHVDPARIRGHRRGAGRAQQQEAVPAYSSGLATKPVARDRWQSRDRSPAEVRSAEDIVSPLRRARHCAGSIHMRR